MRAKSELPHQLSKSLEGYLSSFLLDCTCDDFSFLVHLLGWQRSNDLKRSPTKMTEFLQTALLQLFKYQATSDGHPTKLVGLPQISTRTNLWMATFQSQMQKSLCWVSNLLENFKILDTLILFTNLTLCVDFFAFETKRLTIHKFVMM